MPDPKSEPRPLRPERTRADILVVAARQFSEKGFAWAPIDQVAEATRTSKRMIYYYFGSKDDLYLAVLEDAYSHICQIESALHLEDLESIEEWCCGM